jgi:AcrR family transcriptional regulator
MNTRTISRPYQQTARADAAKATGRDILDAFLRRLMTQWFDEITLDAVAADAGVTVQTVIRRFGGKEGLLESAMQILGEQVNARRSTPSGDLDQVVRKLLHDYEQSGDAIIRLLALEPRHPALKKVMDYGRTEHRAWVTRAFSSTLEGIEPVARKKALDSLVIATDVYTWKLLRRDMARSREYAVSTLTTLVQGALAKFSN